MSEAWTRGAPAAAASLSRWLGERVPPSPGGETWREAGVEARTTECGRGHYLPLFGGGEEGAVKAYGKRDKVVLAAADREGVC